MVALKLLKTIPQINENIRIVRNTFKMKRGGINWIWKN